MSRKKRTFEIAMPEDDVPANGAGAPGPSAPSQMPRRSPMASAIAENAEALQARKSAAEAIREENDTLAHEYVALREVGHVVQAVPLDAVHSYLLGRNRMPREDVELTELVTSIREIGLSNPIRVPPRPYGTGYKLVQGYRRLATYKHLLTETEDELWAQIPALVMPGAAIGGARGCTGFRAWRGAVIRPPGASRPGRRRSHGPGPRGQVTGAGLNSTRSF